MKRLLVLFMITICLMFSGAQSIPATQASGGCELVCGDPFIDPNDAQRYRMCCSEDSRCERACELIPCKAGLLGLSIDGLHYVSGALNAKTILATLDSWERC